MAYADHSQGSTRTVSIVIVALIHAAFGYAFVTGLGYQYVKKAAEQLNVVDVAEEPPPPEEEPPPPPPDRPVPPPPVVTPPPIVNIPVAAPPVLAPPPPPVQAPVFVQAPPPPPRVAASKAAPRGRPGDWVTSDDYPARALREERSGTVGVRLSIGTDGRATGCDVTSSSGHADLDAEACKLLMRRAKFKPAIGSDGQPMTDTWPGRFTWKIPQ